jgi:hypothetical protein
VTLAWRRTRPVLAAGLVVGVASVLLAACGQSPRENSSATTTTVFRWGVVGNAGAITQLELERPTAIAGTKGRVVQIATSNSDGYALTSTGAVYAWESTAPESSGTEP